MHVNTGRGFHANPVESSLRKALNSNSLSQCDHEDIPARTDISGAICLVRQVILVTGFHEFCGPCLETGRQRPIVSVSFQDGGRIVTGPDHRSCQSRKHGWGRHSFAEWRATNRRFRQGLGIRRGIEEQVAGQESAQADDRNGGLAIGLAGGRMDTRPPAQ